jgi:hypothetical protein
MAGNRDRRHSTYHIIPHHPTLQGEIKAQYGDPTCLDVQLHLLGYSWFLKSQPKIIKSIYIVSNLAIRIHQKIPGAKEALNCPWLCAFHNPKATFATVHIIDRFGSW